MKRTLAHLPRQKKIELRIIVKKVLEKLPQTQVIILFGSYARGNYVDCDEREDLGTPDTYMSDYDLLVVTYGVSNFLATQKLKEVSNWYLEYFPEETSVEFINDDMDKVNQELSDGRYFYNEIKAEGITLYDSGNFRLVKRKKLRFDEVKEEAEDYYNDMFERACGFLEVGKMCYAEKEYVTGSYLLHQSCEHLLKAVRLTYTLKQYRIHDLEKMLKAVKRYDLEGFFNVFPRRTKEDKRLFELLKAAYIESRYNPSFRVTKKDLEALISKTEQLLELVKQLCEQRIKEYEDRIPHTKHT